MSDIFRIAANTSSATNKNYIGSAANPFDELYVTDLVTTNLTTKTNSITEDTIIVLNNGETGANSNDLGIVFERGSITNNACFMWDETANRFTLVEATLTGASSGDLNLESATLATLRSILTTTSLTVEGGTSVTGTANSSVTLPKGSINIQALDILNGADGSSNITSTDLFIMYDVNVSADDTPRKVTASALKTYVAASGEALDMTDGGSALAALGDAIANTDRFIIGDASNSFGNRKVEYSTLKTSVLTGNAASATVLASTRTIGGVSFNGSANIDLPGVNSAGNQDTSGNAASATILENARNIGGVSFNGSANIDLPGVNSAGNQDTSGNAATATKLAATKTIGGVAFDGSVNIDLPGVNSAGNQDTTGNASTATLSTSVIAAANNSTDETTYITFVDGATGTQGIETDTGLTYNPSSGVLTSTTFVGALTGNSSTATALASARNIGGVSFDGTGNINLPGVNSAGNQDTSGNAATATVLESSRNIGGVAFNGSANIDLPGVNSAGNQDTSGNAGTASVLATARSIGGVSFNGSADIDLPGVNSAGNQATSGNAATATLAANSTISANNSANETVYLVFVDGATGTQALESDTDLTYNPSTNTLTAVNFAGALTGNASTATILANARNIGGVSFNGSANIDLPGVNAQGNQDTTGNSATATLATSITASANNSTDETVYLTFIDGATGTQGIETDTGLTYNPSTGVLTTTSVTGNLTGAVTGNASTATTLANARNIGGVSFDGSANIDLPGVNSAGNQDTSGNAATATVLESSRNIGGVAFNGSANINLPGVNTAGNQNTSGTAALATQVTVTQNESTDETVYLAFVDGVSGSQDLEADSGLTYNPSTGVLSATISGNITTATEATNVTVVANNTTDETTYLTFVDGATGTQGIETDTGLTYNPSTGILTTTQVTAALSGNASTATEASNVTVTANNSTNETVYLTFVDGATGTQGIETDTALSYNPSTDTLTVGNIAGATIATTTLTAPKFADGGFIADSSGAELVEFDSVSNAVNHIVVTNAAADLHPSLTTKGDSTNIDLKLSAKGTGKVIASDNFEVTGTTHFKGNTQIGEGGSYANLTVYGSLTVDDGSASFDTASLQLSDPLFYIAKDNTTTATADVGFFGKTATVTNGNGSGNSSQCYTGIYYDTDIRNTGNGLYRLFRTPAVSGAVADNVVNIAQSNYATPAIEASNLKSDAFTTSASLTLNLSNRFVFVNGNHEVTLPAPDATYAGVEFVVRNIGGSTPNVVSTATGQVIASDGSSDDDIQLGANSTLRFVCGQTANGGSTYKWYQV